MRLHRNFEHTRTRKPHDNKQRPQTECPRASLRATALVPEDLPEHAREAGSGGLINCVNGSHG